jgi:hypothetical protein
MLSSVYGAISTIQFTCIMIQNFVLKIVFENNGMELAIIYNLYTRLLKSFNAFSNRRQQQHCNIVAKRIIKTCGIVIHFKG